MGTVVLILNDGSRRSHLCILQMDLVLGRSANHPWTVTVHLLGCYSVVCVTNQSRTCGNKAGPFEQFGKRWEHYRDRDSWNTR